MSRIDRDTAVAVILLLVCGIFYLATFSIRDMGYETLGSEVWPRILLVVLTALCLLYLVLSVIRAAKAREPLGAPAGGGLKGWYDTYSNAIWCFIVFGLFLITLPYLGMLIGGVLFVFVTLTLLGGWEGKKLVTHGAIALFTVGAMWALFTFGLRVILPEGEIFTVF